MALFAHWQYLVRAKVSLKIHSNQPSSFSLLSTVEESFFSQVHENLAPQRASLKSDRALFCIHAFQLSRPDRRKCYPHNFSKGVIKKAKNVTRKYIKRHSIFFVHLFVKFICNKVHLKFILLKSCLMFLTYRSYQKTIVVLETYCGIFDFTQKDTNKIG